MRFIVLAALFACAMGASLPRVPAPKWDPNEERIVGGADVPEGHIPFQVRMTSLTGSLRCGGSVFNEWTIITAAHCVEDIVATNWQIVAGDRNQTTVEGTEQTIRIEKAINNSAYIASTFVNDIALLILSEPLTLTEQVQPIKLPTEVGEVPAGTNVTISGWGTTRGGGIQSQTLKAVTVPVVSDDDCRVSYGAEDIVQSMLCAGLPEGGKDSCQGDSGGPLFTCNDAMERDCTLWGIVSWGNGCALAGYPGVYTEVPFFLTWIVENAKYQP